MSHLWHVSKTLRFLKRHLTLTHKVSANMTEHQIKLRSKTKQSIYIDCDFDEQCTYHSKDYNEVLKHLENDHGLVEKKEKVNCDICEKVFIFVDDFKSHFNTKHNNFKFQLPRNFGANLYYCHKTLQ